MSATALPGQGRALVLDGGLATELERRGASLRDPLWSARVLLEEPERLVEVHCAYIQAGADVLITASYQASTPGLAARGLGAGAIERVLGASVRLARQAWERFLEQQTPDTPERAPPLVAASIGPYGAWLHDGSEYRGDYGLGDRELARFHDDRLAILIDSDADLLAVETIPSRREAEVVVDLLERRGRGAAWISFTGRDKTRIADGTPFAECVRSLQASERVVAVGVNCTPPAIAGALLESAAGIATKPFVVYPNSGESYRAGTGRWTGAAVADWVDREVPRYLAAGARFVGGCCRTTPDDISRIRAMVDQS